MSPEASGTRTPPGRPGASDARRWWALIAISASVLVVGLDLTVLNLALPVLSTQLHASTTDLQWFSAAYSLVLAAALLPAGMLGDRAGRKKMLLIALVVFGASSAACAFAGSAGELIAARAVLGLGAAMIFPMSIAVLPVLFAPEERPRAIAAVMGATFIAYPVGPLLGGWLLDNFWWGSVFLINVPVVVVALVAVALLLPESHGARSARIDVPGIILSSLGLAGLTYGCIKAGQDGWSDPAALATILAGALVLALFVLWERRAGRRGQALVQLELFRSAAFTWGTILTTFVSFAMFGILFAMPQYFQEVRGLDSLATGLRMLPMIGGMVVGMIGGTRLQTPPKGPGGGRGRSSRQRQDPGDGRLRGDGRRPGRGRHHQRGQRIRVHRDLVCGGRAGPGAGHARCDERRARRADAGAEWIRVGADHRDAPGRGHDRGRGAGHCPAVRLPQPARPGRAPGRGLQRGADRDRGGSRGGGRAALGRAARRGARRVRARPRRHAGGMRGHCRAQRPARAGLPAPPARSGGAGWRTGPSRPRPALRSRSRARTGRIRGMSTHDDDQPGLRERKKARTRASIREHALRLFQEQGYAATRVEQIAEAAEVSPATFYRYFPTKEDVVLQDDLDLLTLDALEAQPAGLSPLAAVRAAVAAARARFTPEERERFRQTTELTMAVPEIRARALDEFARTIDVTAAVLARRSGRKPDDVAVRALAGAIFGVILASTLPVLERGQLDLDAIFAIVDTGLAQLEAGFTL